MGAVSAQSPSDPLGRPSQDVSGEGLPPRVLAALGRVRHANARRAVAVMPERDREQAIVAIADYCAIRGFQLYACGPLETALRMVLTGKADVVVAHRDGDVARYLEVVDRPRRAQRVNRDRTSFLSRAEKTPTAESVSPMLRRTRPRAVPSALPLRDSNGGTGRA